MQSSSVIRKHLFGATWRHGGGILELLQQKGVSSYDPEITNEFVDLQQERRDRDEISSNYLRMITYAAKRLNQYFLSGTLVMKMPKLGSPFRVSPQNEQLISDFIQTKGYGPNTRDDAVWVVRRYLSHFEKLGYPTLEDVTVDLVRNFILKTASVLNVIDTTTEAGKRDRAMILIAATTGLWACDLIRLKLTDVDWEKAEIKLVQQKTSRTVYCPLLWEAGEALQDYILNARPKTGCSEIFLRTVAPKTAISTAAAVGFMFKTYQTKAGIPSMGKGFMACAGGWQKSFLFSVRRLRLLCRFWATVTWEQSGNTCLWIPAT